jgi:LysM repeat protein
VKQAGPDGITVAHPDGSQTKYAGLGAARVKDGDEVTPDTILGTVAAAQGAEAALRYTVLHDGQPADPASAIERVVQASGHDGVQALVDAIANHPDPDYALEDRERDMAEVARRVALSDDQHPRGEHMAQVGDDAASPGGNFGLVAYRGGLGPDSVAQDNSADPEEDGPEIVIVGRREEPTYDDEIVIKGYRSSYTVAPGQTLSEIAGDWGMDYHKIMEINEIENPISLKGGSRISMPSYTVRQGDTLDTIARRLGTTVKAIVDTNENLGANLQPGQKLMIDAVGVSPTRSRAGGAPATRARTPRASAPRSRAATPPAVGWRTGGRMTSRAVEQHAEHAMAQYAANIAWGMDPVDAAAWAAVSEAESSGNPQARQNPGPGRGLYQWGANVARFDRRRDFQRVIGVPVEQSTQDQQFRFRDWELANTEARAARRIAATANPGDRAEAITRYYERPAEPDRDSADRANIAEAIARRASARP